MCGRIEVNHENIFEGSRPLLQGVRPDLQEI